MTKLTIYAIAFARIIILLIGYLFSAIFFLFTIIGQIGEIYLTAFVSFQNTTKALLTRYSEMK
jgi:hypothetical protein